MRGKKRPCLDKLCIEFTHSRPRHSNDNGLAETKNGAVVRKAFGYEHIHRRHAKRFDTYCLEYLNPFLNFHWPCLLPPNWSTPTRLVASSSCTERAMR